jgi:RimJ/RimL family protein N-acetyltransferase
MSEQSRDDAPILTIAGERVALGPVRRGLLPLYQRWMNDFEVTRTLAVGLRPMTAEDEQAWFDRVATGERDVVFTIYERRPTLRPIGASGLHGVDHRHRTAEFGIMIGDKTAWGKGYGTEATRLVLDYAFVGLGLHNVLLRAYAFNDRGLRVYEKAGFRPIGRRREAHRFAGRAYDVVYMDCVATDFESPVLGSLIP